MAAGQPFSFIHAGDLQLGTLPQGVNRPASEQVRQILLDCSWLSAENVFRTAVERDVDFLLLNGSLVQENARGPRSAFFLREHFERLGDKNIPVVIHSGSGEWWSRWCVFPDNVKVLGASVSEVFVSTRSGAEILIDSGHAVRLHTDGSPFRVALRENSIPERPEEYGYVAVAGNGAPGNLVSSGDNVWTAGSPFAVNRDDGSSRGCLLARVGANGSIDVGVLETSVLRWRDERIVLSQDVSRTELEAELRERARSLQAAASVPLTIVSWQLEGPSEMDRWLEDGNLSAQLLNAARDIDPATKPLIWSNTLESLSPFSAVRSACRDRPLTVDFLKVAQKHFADPSSGSGGLDVQFLRSVGIQPADDPAARETVCRDAVLAGVRLLTS